MSTTRSFRYLTLLTSLSSLVVLPQCVLAQPDTTPRGMVPIPEKPPLTVDELDKITGGPTRVTFSGQNVALAEVVKVLQGAAVTTPVFGTPALPAKAPATISVDWKEVPFWDAAREVEKLTGLRWVQSPQGGLTLVAPSAAEGADLNGLLIGETPYAKVYAGSIWHTAVTTASIAGKETVVPPADTTRMTATVYLDPKLKATPGTLRAVDLALPGTNLPIPPVAPVAGNIRLGQNFISVGRSITGNLIAPLTIELPVGIIAGTVLKDVSAKVRVSATANAKTWKIDDLLNAADAQETLDGAQFTVVDAKITGRRLRVNLEVDADAATMAAFNNGSTTYLREAFAIANVPAVNPPALTAVRQQIVIGGGGNFGGQAIAIDPVVQAEPANVNAEPFPGNIGRAGNFGGPAAAAAAAGIPNATRGLTLAPGRPGGNIVPDLGRLRYVNNPFSNVVVADSKGRQLRNQGSNVSRANGLGDRQKTKIELNFEVPEGIEANVPFTMNWALPAASRNVDTPFELKELKVP